MEFFRRYLCCHPKQEVDNELELRNSQVQNKWNGSTSDFHSNKIYDKSQSHKKSDKRNPLQTQNIYDCVICATSVFELFERFSVAFSKVLVQECCYTLKTCSLMHWPGIEPGPPAWQARILPLNHQCCWRYQVLEWTLAQCGGISYKTNSPVPNCVPFLTNSAFKWRPNFKFWYIYCIFNNVTSTCWFCL